jgi:hypothetical protein
VVLITPRNFWHDCIHENVSTSKVDKHTHFQKGKETCDFCQLGFQFYAEETTPLVFHFAKKGIIKHTFNYSSSESFRFHSVSGRGPPVV